MHINAGISASNVGFRLLKRAGWQEGQGLGAQEQGRTQPLQAQPNQGLKGLGYGPAGQQPPQGGSQQAAGGTKRDRGLAADGSGEGRGPGRPIGPVLGQGRVAALAAAELATEDLETKVKRHRQVTR